MTLLRQLQDDAINPTVDITTLLRKARILAARLKNKEFEQWVKYEMDGYPNETPLPEYRVLSVNAKASLMIGYAQLPSALVMASLIPEKFRVWATTTFLRSSISELASLITSAQSHSLCCPWPQEIAVKYGASGYGGRGRVRAQCLRAWQEISPGSIVAIIETVRNRLLEFVLQIELAAPDAGEAVGSEPPLPQETVHQIFNTYISGGTAHVAGAGSSSTANIIQASSLNNSPVQQAGTHSAQTLSFSSESQERPEIERLVREVSAHLSELNLDARASRKVETQLATDPRPACRRRTGCRDNCPGGTNPA